MTNTLENVTPEYLETLLAAYAGIAGVDDVVDQLENEERIKAIGYAKSIRTHEKGADSGHYSSTKTGKWALGGTVSALSAKLAAVQSELTNKRGPRNVFLKVFGLNLSTDQIAYLTIKATIDKMMGSLGKRGGTTTVSRLSVQSSVMKSICNEAELFLAEKAAHFSFRNAMEQIKEGNLGGERAMRAVQKRMAHHGVEYEKISLPTAERRAIGLHLMKYLIEATGIIEEMHDVVTMQTSKDYKQRSELFYAFTPEFVEKLMRTEEAISMREARHEPMLVSPVPWSYDNMQHGPYLHPLTNQYPLVKRFNKAYQSELQNSAASQVLLDTVNAIQSVPYIVNEYVLDAVEWSDNHDSTIGGLPPKEQVEYPAWDEAYRSDKAAMAEWREAFTRAQKTNAQRVSQGYALACTLDSANRYLGRPLWFPVQLDNRGRAYPMATYGLTYQGSGFQKALLQSYVPVPINTQEQLDALYIQCATEGEFDGVDKASFADRIQWVKDNLDDVITAGTDYRDNWGWWSEAADGKPFMFLAACNAIAEFHRQGWGYQCHLFAYEDATCSGIQVYSALFRDELGGFNVNLVPGHDRQDIYGLAAQEAVRILEARDDLTNEEQAYRRTILEYGVTRSACKRQTMTKPYNSKQRSCFEYTLEWVVKQEKHGLIAPDLGKTETGGPVGTTFKMAQLLSSAIWEAIGNVAPKPCEAMTWIEDVTKMVVQANPDAPLQWSLPDGMVCVIDKQKQDEARIDTRINGSIVGQRMMLDNGKQDVRKHGNAAPPNFVHSLDALHLREAARLWEDKCAAQGRKPVYTFVHDSFGVPAADMPEFHACIREAFVRLYTEYDLLGSFLASMQELAGPDVVFPQRPSMGTLDIAGVMASEFFFS